MAFIDFDDVAYEDRVSSDTSEDFNPEDYPCIENETEEGYCWSLS